MGSGVNNQICFLFTGRWVYKWSRGGGGLRSGGIIIRSIQYHHYFITQRVFK